MNIVQKSLNRVESLMRMRLPVGSVMKAGDLWYQRVKTAGRPTDWVFEDWVNQVEKAKKIAIGDIITRPDGTKWKKTSTFGYTKIKDNSSTSGAQVATTTLQGLQSDHKLKLMKYLLNMVKRVFGN